jgi:KipI family sensor histidine kinase inhibitor
VPAAWSLRPAGDRALLIDPGSERSEVRPALLAVSLRQAAAEEGIEVVEVVPGASTVLVQLSRPGDLERLMALTGQIRASLTDDVAGGGPVGEADPAVTIEVVYDGADLAEVATAAGMSEAAVVQRHTGGRYHAAFCGFAPGFAYLEGLDSVLWVPRLAQARPVVPAGSVAVADRYSAVYPRATPGGWRLLGRTDAVVWDAGRTPPATLTPGREVRFRAVRAR